MPHISRLQRGKGSRGGSSSPRNTADRGSVGLGNFHSQDIWSRGLGQKQSNGAFAVDCADDGAELRLFLAQCLGKGASSLPSRRRRVSYMLIHCVGSALLNDPLVPIEPR